MVGVGWENRKATDATSHYFLKMETAALARQPFCRTVAVLQKPHHRRKVEHRAEFPFPPVSFMMFDPYCDQNQHKWHTSVRWRSRALIVRLPVGGRMALIRVVGALMRRWWVRGTPQGGTNMATEVVLRLHHVSTGGSPRKKTHFQYV